MHKVKASLVVAALLVPGPLVSQPSAAPRDASPQEVGSARVVPIQVTGDPEARFSMVVMGDGYTAAEMPRYREHLDKHLNILWSIEPFRSYRNYINVYSVEIVSGDSGITCDPEVRLQKNTPLGLNFGGGCTNINARGITVAQGKQQAVRDYAAKATPHFDQILIIANTDTYGGIGGNLATTSGGNSLGPLITPHELGHSLGRLQDEYTYSARGKPGGPYTGGEPNSGHMTIMSIEDMLTKQAKWFRWLGEESESGGKIGRYEGGSSRTTGIWRPSKHSMMISVGYYFDQPSRERMVQRISEQVKLIADSSSLGAGGEPVVNADELAWIETPQPVYHDLTVTWSVDGKVIPSTGNPRFLELRPLNLPAGAKLTVTVVDPTPFVRDPEIRAKALTAMKTWTVRASNPGSSIAGVVLGDSVITGGTQNERPIGGRDVVYVTLAQPTDRLVTTAWRLNGAVVPEAANSRNLALAPRKLPSGTHKVSVTSGSATREWTIDNVLPTTVATIATPVATIAGAEPHYFIRDEFTMKLEPTDDQPGYVVAEFRVNGDGWHHYYGWPDAPPGTPYKFTPRGTTIKELVYGSLASEGLSPQPWEPREPGWGTHRIEYRAIDAAGNIGAAKAYRVTFEGTLSCTATVSGAHAGDVVVKDGITCLAPGATVTGNVSVAAGASLVATSARVTGAITATNAATVELVNANIGGAVRIAGATERVTVFGSTTGGLSITGSKTKKPATNVGNRTGNK